MNDRATSERRGFQPQAGRRLVGEHGDAWRVRRVLSAARDFYIAPDHAARISDRLEDLQAAFRIAHTHERQPPIGQ